MREHRPFQQLSKGTLSLEYKILKAGDAKYLLTLKQTDVQSQLYLEGVKSLI